MKLKVERSLKKNRYEITYRMTTSKISYDKKKFKLLGNQFNYTLLQDLAN